MAVPFSHFCMQESPKVIPAGDSCMLVALKGSAWPKSHPASSVKTGSIAPLLTCNHAIEWSKPVFGLL